MNWTIILIVSNMLMGLLMSCHASQEVLLDGSEISLHQLPSLPKLSFTQETVTTNTSPSLSVQKQSVPTTPAIANITSIKLGTFFSECWGYCNTELLIQPPHMRLVRSSLVERENYPDLISEESLTQQAWTDLVALVDLEKFQGLPKMVGCPDCGDGGGEWLEISDSKTTQRVTFEYGTSLPEIAELLTKLRTLREKFITQNNR